MIVAGEMLEQRDHVLYDNGRWHALDEFGKVISSLSADHWRVIVD